MQAAKVLARRASKTQEARDCEACWEAIDDGETSCSAHAYVELDGHLIPIFNIPGFEYLASGRHRSAFYRDRFVFKYSPKNIRDEHNPNIAERDLFGQLRSAGKPYALDAIYIDCGRYGSVSVMRYVDGFHPEECYDSGSDTWSIREIQDARDDLEENFNYFDMHDGNVIMTDTGEWFLIDGGM